MMETTKLIKPINNKWDDTLTDAIIADAAVRRPGWPEYLARGAELEFGRNAVDDNLHGPRRLVNVAQYQAICRTIGVHELGKSQWNEVPFSRFIPFEII